MNIFQIYESLGNTVPFIVKREWWGFGNYILVTEVTIVKYPYGFAKGIYHYADGKVVKQNIVCAGSYQWVLLSLANDTFS